MLPVSTLHSPLSIYFVGVILSEAILQAKRTILPADLGF